MQMKNSYIGYFKKDSVKKQEEVDQQKAKDTKFAFDKVFEMDDETLADAKDYCMKCKRESRWCKHRKALKEHKDIQSQALTSTQVVGWREPYDNLTGALSGYNRTGMCMRTFKDTGHL